MSTIQVVLDDELLREAGRAARRGQINRSALIRHALREHLRRLDLAEKERLDREGYRRQPDSEEDLKVWERVAAWPED